MKVEMRLSEVKVSYRWESEKWTSSFLRARLIVLFTLLYPYLLPDVLYSCIVLKLSLLPPTSFLFIHLSDNNVFYDDMSFIFSLRCSSRTINMHFIFFSYCAFIRFNRFVREIWLISFRGFPSFHGRDLSKKWKF